MFDTVPTINFGSLFNQIYVFVLSLRDFPDFWLATVLPVLYPVSFILSVFFIAMTVYSAVRLSQLTNLERVVAENTSEQNTVADTQGDPRLNERWRRVQKLSNSESEGDWRMAIIEADTILEEMVNKMGYDGASLGEKMRQIEKSDFNTLNQAWEAHKVRNEIAHAGIDFALSEREKNRVIGLYKEVFEEFYYI